MPPPLDTTLFLLSLGYPFLILAAAVIPYRWQYFAATATLIAMAPLMLSWSGNALARPIAFMVLVHGLKAVIELAQWRRRRGGRDRSRWLEG